MKTRVYDGFVKIDKVKTSAGPREVVIATDSVAFLLQWFFARNAMSRT